MTTTAVRTSIIFTSSCDTAELQFWVLLLGHYSPGDHSKVSQQLQKHEAYQ